MKKYLLILLVLFPLSSFALSIEPQTAYRDMPQTLLTITCEQPHYFMIFHPDNSAITAGDCLSYTVDKFPFDPPSYVSGIYTILEFTSNDPLSSESCNYLDTCISYASPIDSKEFYYLNKGTTGISGLITDSTAKWESTTGIPTNTITPYLRSNVALVIGTGLGVLQALLPWIVALVAIGAIVYLLYRAFRFFNH